MYFDPLRGMITCNVDPPAIVTEITISLNFNSVESLNPRWRVYFLTVRENDYIAFDEYYNDPIGRSFGNCEIPFVTS